MSLRLWPDDRPVQESFVFCLGLKSLVALSAGAGAPPVNPADETARHPKEDKCTTKTLEAEGLYFYIAPGFQGSEETPTTSATSACDQARSMIGSRDSMPRAPIHQPCPEMSRAASSVRFQRFARCISW
jgi:hypothetical protein